MTIRTAKLLKVPKLLLAMTLTSVLILSSSAFYSCSSTQQTSGIHKVRLLISASVNWDEDVEADGVQFLLIPEDSDGWPVRGELTVNASLWSQPDIFKRGKGKLIQEWKDIRITKRTYEGYGEARVRLEYSGYVPQPNEYGILEIKVQTADGRVFSFEESIKLGYSSTEQESPGCCF